MVFYDGPGLVKPFVAVCDKRCLSRKYGIDMTLRGVICLQFTSFNSIIIPGERHLMTEKFVSPFEVCFKIK
jgi:hypothetical protein